MGFWVFILIHFLSIGVESLIRNKNNPKRNLICEINSDFEVKFPKSFYYKVLGIVFD